MEAWKQEDDAKLRELTEQLRKLHTVPRPSNPLPNVDNLIPKIQALVISNMQEEINGLAPLIRDACSQNSHTFISDLFKRLQPTLDMTNEICRRADSIASKLLIS